MRLRGEGTVRRGEGGGRREGGLRGEKGSKRRGQEGERRGRGLGGDTPS